MNNLLAPIVSSAGLGALIGLIRQWSEQSKSEGEADFGGVRTHTFWAVLGCISAIGTDHGGPWILPMVILVVSAQLIGMHWTPSARRAPGGTGFAAWLLTFFTGALVAWDHTQSAILVAALTMILLGLKQPIHAWTRHFTAEDIRGTLRFAAITGVVLPLVPNRDMGPFNAFNPYSTWMMVVLISGLGFSGYIAMRALGARAGIVVTSLFGGLASSTASTLAFSRESRDAPEMSAHYAFAVTTACTVMIPRVLAVVALINPELALRSAPALALMAVPALIHGTLFWFGSSRKSPSQEVSSPHIHNPLGLSTAIKFGLIYAIIAFLVHVIIRMDLQDSLLPLSFLSGLTDMDAIALSMARTQGDQGISLELAAHAVVIGAVANSLLKAALAMTLGSPVHRRTAGGVLIATAVVGGIGILIF